MNKNKKIIEVLSLKVLLISAIFILAIFMFAMLAEGVLQGKQRAIDNNIFLFFDSITTPALVKAMEVFSFFGSIQFMVPAYLVLIASFFIKRKFRNGIDVAIIGASSTAMIFGLKIFFHRQRPNLPILNGLHTFSFPSGHALSSFILCSLLIFIIHRRKWKKIYKWIATIFLSLVSITIGISRIILRMHYPTDVIASLCLGIVWVIISLWIFKKINRQYMVSNNLSSANAEAVTS